MSYSFSPPGARSLLRSRHLPIPVIPGMQSTNPLLCTTWRDSYSTTFHQSKLFKNKEQIWSNTLEKLFDVFRLQCFRPEMIWWCGLMYVCATSVAALLIVAFSAAITAEPASMAITGTAASAPQASRVQTAGSVSISLAPDYCQISV